jgi:hypothetical protein
MGLSSTPLCSMCVSLFFLPPTPHTLHTHKNAFLAHALTHKHTPVGTLCQHCCPLYLLFGLRPVCVWGGFINMHTGGYI